MATIGVIPIPALINTIGSNELRLRTKLPFGGFTSIRAPFLILEYINWPNNSPQNGVNGFSVGTAKYSAGAAATGKATLQNTFGWTNMVDGGLV